MKIAVYDDGRVGLVRDGTLIDVTDLVGGGAGEWPPVFILRAIAGFDRLRPKRDQALLTVRLRLHWRRIGRTMIASGTMKQLGPSMLAAPITRVAPATVVGSVTPSWVR